MGTRIPLHQLSNGLYISIRPEQNKPPRPHHLTIGSGTVPSTSGDINKSRKTGKVILGHRNSDPRPISKRSSWSGQIVTLHPTRFIAYRNVELGRVDVSMVAFCLRIGLRVFCDDVRV
ncbi:hypothetical protein R6Q59_017543 [Mikania micrantha]